MSYRALGNHFLLDAALTPKNLGTEFCALKYRCPNVSPPGSTAHCTNSGGDSVVRLYVFGFREQKKWVTWLKKIYYKKDPKNGTITWIYQ